MFKTYKPEIDIIFRIKSDISLCEKNIIKIYGSIKNKNNKYINKNVKNLLILSDYQLPLP